MRLIDADMLPRLGTRGGLVHWKDIKDAPTVNMWSLVLDYLLEVSMFRMEFDAKNGNEHFMYGIATVMDYIAEKADREDEYTRIFNDGLNLSRSKVANARTEGESMRLIDADKLADEIAVFFERNEKLIDEWIMSTIEDEIETAPTVDAVEVVKQVFDGEMILMPLEVKGCATCEYDNTKSRYPCFNCKYNPTLMDEWRKKI